jgi:urocanate hydratase
MFPDDERLQHWIPLVSKCVRSQGLPARAVLLRERDRGVFALGLNDLVARGEIAAPILIGSEVSPSKSTAAALSQIVKTLGGPEGKAGDALSTALQGAASGACWVSIRGGAHPGDLPQYAAQAFVADGTSEARERLAYWPRNGVGPKVARSSADRATETR